MNKEDKEEWRDVVGFEEYFQVSNKGQVFSKRTNKTLKQTKLKTGYLVINTKIGGRKGTYYSLRVHRMVAEAFLEMPDLELVEKCSLEHHGKVLVRHLDGDKTNNSYVNLAWGSCQDNSDDYVVSGKSLENSLKTSGVLNAGAKFSVEQINYIRNAEHRTFRSLAREMGVHHSTISNIINCISYK